MARTPLTLAANAFGSPRLASKCLRQGEAVFDELRGQWELQIGPAELAALETHLATLVGALPVRPDAPGWIAYDLGGPA